MGLSPILDCVSSSCAYDSSVEGEFELLRPVAQAMRAGKGKVLVGAGLSMQSGLSSWLDLLRPVVQDGLGIHLTVNDDLPEIAQYYADTVAGGRQRMLAAVAADINREATPSPAHMALADLPIAECWTTNFDDLLERVLVDYRRVDGDADLVDMTRLSAPIIVKMHGSLPAGRLTAEQLGRVVLTRDDFDTYQDRHPRLWSRLASGYLSGSMLFLGLSLSDPNMRLLLRLARAAARSGVDSSSVVVLKEPDDEQERKRFVPRVNDLARSGITVLPVASHDDLVPILERLRERLRPPRVIISGSTTALDDDATTRALEAAELLGAQLAQRGISIVHGGSDVGTVVARRLAETADLLHQYDPTLITAVRRRVIHSNEYIGYPPGPGIVGMPRDGTIRFIGSTPQEMRASLLTLGCVVAVIGGGAGTAEELSQFEQAGLTIIPWPATGGTAQTQASLLDAALSSRPVSQRTHVRKALSSPDLALGAVAFAEVLEHIWRSYADTGPTAITQ